MYRLKQLAYRPHNKAETSACLMYLGHLDLQVEPNTHLMQVWPRDRDTFVCLTHVGHIYFLVLMDRKGNTLQSFSLPVSFAQSFCRIISLLPSGLTLRACHDERSYLWKELGLHITRPVEYKNEAPSDLSSLDLDGQIYVGGKAKVNVYMGGPGPLVWGYFGCDEESLYYYRRDINASGLSLYRLPLSELSSEPQFFTHLPDPAPRDALSDCDCFFGQLDLLVGTNAMGGCLLYHYQRVWSPSSHHLFPRQQRDMIKTLLMLQSRGAAMLPRDVLPLLLDYVMS